MENTLTYTVHNKAVQFYLSVKDFLDLNCFAINKHLTIYALSNKHIYTMMRNIPNEIMHQSLKTHLSLHVRNLQQLEAHQESLHINNIVLSSNSNSTFLNKENIPSWIKERFSIIYGKNKVIISKLICK